MKNIKILSILILLLGFVSAYSQQTATGVQKSDQMQNAGQQDRTTLSPNPPSGSQNMTTASAPVPGSQSSKQLDNNADPGKSDGFPSPNPPSDPELSRQTASIQPETGNVENQGPRPSDPKGVKPDTK